MALQSFPSTNPRRRNWKIFEYHNSKKKNNKRKLTFGEVKNDDGPKKRKEKQTTMKKISQPFKYHHGILC